MLTRMMSFVCDAFNVLGCSRCFGLLLGLPVLSLVADPVTVHSLHLLSKFGNNFSERNIK